MMDNENFVNNDRREKGKNIVNKAKDIASISIIKPLTDFGNNVMETFRNEQI
jgi:hypothetical protein